VATKLDKSYATNTGDQKQQLTDSRRAEAIRNG